MSIVSVKEIMQEQQEKEKRLFTKEGIDGVSVVDDVITLDGWYWIELSRVKTKLALLHWVAHLLGKKWVTKKQLSWLVRVASDYHNYNPHTETPEE